jgi:hypothetical protein
VETSWCSPNFNLLRDVRGLKYDLQQSVSSELAKVVEEEIKTRELLNKRMTEQSGMLDNIQHRRKP